MFGAPGGRALLADLAAFVLLFQAAHQRLEVGYGRDSAICVDANADKEAELAYSESVGKR